MAWNWIDYEMDYNVVLDAHVPVRVLSTFSAENIAHSVHYCSLHNAVQLYLSIKPTTGTRTCTVNW